MIAFKNGTIGLGKDGPNGNRTGKELGLRLGTLNIRTLRGKTEELVDMVQRRRIDVLGLAETKWRGEGRKQIRGGYTLYWKGNQDGRRNGVAVVVRDGMKEEVVAVSDRIIKMKVKIKERVLEIIQVYAPQVGCSAKEKEEFEEELQKQVRTSGMIVMGDLNGHVGVDRAGYEEVIGTEGWGSRNREGQRLLDFCKRNNIVICNTWHKKKESHKVTWYSGDWTRRSVVDYIMVTEEMKGEMMDVKVIPSERLDSDHRLLVMTLRIRRQRGGGEKQERRIRIWRLKDRDKEEEYKRILKGKLPKDVGKSGEEEWIRFRTEVVSAAEAVCGRTSGRRREKETPWWTDRARAAVTEKNKAFRRWFQERSVRTKEEYRKLRRKASKIVSEEKRKWLEEWTNVLEEDARGNKKVLYSTVKGKRRVKTEGVRMVDEGGKEVEEGDALRELWRQYFEKLLNPRGTGGEEEVGEEEEESEEREKELSWREVEEAVKRMKKGRAAGVDEVTIEMVTAAGEIGMQWFYRVVRAIWKEMRTPGEWKKAVIVPIFKKGNKKECQNYRGISLMCQSAKVYEKIIERRLRERVGNMREEQYGFRPGRSTIDLIFAVRQLQEKHIEYGDDLVMVFLDMEKAYDSVSRNKVWEALRRKKVEKDTIRRVREMYEGSESCVKVGVERSGWLRQESGLRQGSALSPLLFIVVMDELMERVARRIGEDKMKVMAFADDLMLWGSREEEVQVQLDAWIEEGTHYGMKFNAKKSEYMVTTRDKGRVGGRVMLGEEEMRRVSHFKYLGSVIEEEGRIDREINERGRQAGAFMRATGTLVRSSWVPQKSKKVIYRNYYVPILIYGAETWTMGGRDKSRVQAGEMRFLRSRIGVTRRDRMRNEDIRNRVGEEPLIDEIEKRRLKWYGHMKRMSDSRLPKMMHEREMEGSRARGRPRRRWIGGVMEAVERREADWGSVVRERWWEDRRRWRGLCAKQTQ